MTTTPALPDHLRRLALRVAQHEMGHYVVARALGFRVGSVSITIIGPIDGHRGTSSITLPEPISSLSDLQTYLQRRVIVLYAGAAAETLSAGAPEKGVDNDAAVNIIRNPGQGAEQDHAKARELIHILRNVLKSSTDVADHDATQAELDELDGELWRRAVELVERHAETIVGLGANLAGRVRQANAAAVLDAAYLEGLAGVQTIPATKPFEDKFGRF